MQYCVCLTTSPLPPRPSIPPSPVLRHCLWYISVPCSSVMMASRTCLTSDPSGKIPLSMSTSTISIVRRYLGNTSTA